MRHRVSQRKNKNSVWHCENSKKHCVIILNDMNKPIVSIIVPVYNAEKILHLALNSILKQSYSEIEVIVINDCSTDDSLSKLQEFTRRFKDRCYSLKIITHEVNKGVASARNTGLKNATGEYIYYVDADDWIEPNTIELLASEATTQQAEIVGCNWFLSFEKNERQMNQPVFTSSKDALERIMLGVMRWNLWLFLVKHSLYEENKICFISGANMGEDMMVMLKILSKAERVSFVNKPLYHYSRLNNTVTANYSLKHVGEVSKNMQEVEVFFRKNGMSFDSSLLQLKLTIKLPLLFTGKKQDFLLWREWFSEANKVVLQNKCLPLHTKIIQWCAYKHLYLPIKLYNAIVLKFIYGILYK